VKIKRPVNLAVLNDHVSHKIDDATWTEIVGLVKPRCRLSEVTGSAYSRRFFDAMLRSLRAGGTPVTNLDTSVVTGCVTRVHLELLKVGLWPDLMQLLRRHGHDWPDNLSSDVKNYLDGTYGDPRAAWQIIRTPGAPLTVKECA
jgi:hypothetical protein